MIKCRNPKCDNVHDGSYGSGVFCSRFCANSKVDVHRDSVKVSACVKCKKIICINKRTSHLNAYCDVCKKLNYNKRHFKEENPRCKICGSFIGTCKKPDICRKYRLIYTLIANFNFNKEALGSTDVYNEYNRIKKEFI